jgi:hypothetical protein
VPHTIKRVLTLAGILASAAALAVVNDDLEPQTPAAFLPGGLLGVQIGNSWEESKRGAAFKELSCQAVEPKADDADEVCFFRAAAASTVAGAAIHDGFMVRKGDRLVLIGTGIAIQNPDDPLAESVVRTFQAQIHTAFQHTGDEVLFVKLPARRMSPAELSGFSQRAPVLLVQLEHKNNELAVLYGYLAPVNLFGSLSAE